VQAPSDESRKMLDVFPRGVQASAFCVCPLRRVRPLCHYQDTGSHRRGVASRPDMLRDVVENYGQRTTCSDGWSMRGLFTSSIL
jgi:hypothetical protein